MAFTFEFEEKSFCALSKIVYAPLPKSRYYGAGPAATPRTNWNATNHKNKKKELIAYLLLVSFIVFWLQL